MTSLNDCKCFLKQIDLQSKNCKSIIIYNPLSNIGHFDSWCYIFAKILLDSGWIVVVVTKNTKNIIREFETYDDKFKDKLILINQTNDIFTNDKSSVFENIIKKSKILEFIDKIRIKDYQKYHKITNSVKRSLLNKYNNCLIKIELFLLKFITSRLKINPNDQIKFALDINLLVHALGTKPNIVLNMYLDLYNPEIKVWDEFSKIMTCKWAGIHMDTSHKLIERPYSKSDNLKVIYTINEHKKNDENVDGESFVYQWLPDVTNVSLPTKLSQITSSIIKFAAGRKIIFLGGSIGISKNLSLWAKLIFKLDPKEWYFVQIGKIEYSTLSADDLSGLHSLQNLEIENIYISDEYLTDETVFNEIMSVSSIIWGLYKDFDRSSNILTKAALLFKPIVVSNRFLMGQRVNKYQIGIAVSETNIESLINGINWLIKNPIPIINFKKYADHYNTKELSNKLIKSLSDII